jgi:hypothetical protein
MWLGTGHRKADSARCLNIYFHDRGTLHRFRLSFGNVLTIPADITPSTLHFPGSLDVFNLKATSVATYQMLDFCLVSACPAAISTHGRWLEDGGEHWLHFTGVRLEKLEL